MRRLHCLLLLFSFSVFVLPHAQNWFLQQKRRKSGDRQNWQTQREALLPLNFRRAYSEAVLQRLQDCVSAQRDALVGQNVWVCCRPYQEGILAGQQAFVLGWPELHERPLVQANTDDASDPLVWVRGRIVSVSYHGRRAKVREFSPEARFFKQRSCVRLHCVRPSLPIHCAPASFFPARGSFEFSNQATLS